MRLHAIFYIVPWKLPPLAIIVLYIHVSKLRSDFQDILISSFCEITHTVKLGFDFG